MSELFEIRSPQSEGSPLLYLHGLGSPDPLSSEMRHPLESLGFSVWSMHRADEALLNGPQPQAELIEGCREAVMNIAKQTRAKITLVGNSLGSYLAVMTALQIPDKIQAVLGTDAFLEPRLGFNLMEKWSLEMASKLNKLPADAVLSDYGSAFKSQLSETENTHFVVGLINNRWIKLPRGLGGQFNNITAQDTQTLLPPTHLIFGEKDPFIQNSPANLVPSASVFKVDSADHNEWMQSALAVESARQFLSDNRA